MTTGQAVNLWGSVLALVGCAAFVGVYSLLAPWWRSQVGRLLVLKAAAIAVLMAITICMAALTAADVEILRLVRGALAALFGVLMLYQAWLVGHTQTKGASVMTHPAAQPSRPARVPSVGRIVHYVSHGTPVRADGGQAYTSQCRAAVVTAVHGPAAEPTTLEDSPMYDVGLAVLNPTGVFFHEHAVQMESARDGGTWHFPERV